MSGIIITDAMVQEACRIVGMTGKEAVSEYAMKAALEGVLPSIGERLASIFAVDEINEPKTIEETWDVAMKTGINEAAKAIRAITAVSTTPSIAP